MMGPEDDWTSVRLPGGPTVPVRKDSPVDVALDNRMPSEEGAPSVRMPWSLGLLGDYLWTHLEEARPHIAKLIHEEVGRAIDEGRLLHPLDPMVVAREVLRYDLLEPALNRYPAGADRLAEFLRAVRNAYQAEEEGWPYAREALSTFVLDWLTSPGRLAIVEELDPQLAVLIK